MIIEGAFYKLIEQLKFPFTNFKEICEAQLASIFRTTILKDLKSRDAEYPESNLTIGPPYEIPPDGQKHSRKIDILIKLEKIGNMEYLLSGLQNYDVNRFNWIEVKFFRGKSNKSRGNIKDTGYFLADIIRLLYLPKINSRTPTNKEAGRYLLTVFDQEPKKYLRFDERKYLENILEQEETEVKIPIQKELNNSNITRYVRTKIEAEEITDNAVIIKTRRHKVVPTRLGQIPCYWTYLVKIVECSIVKKNRKKQQRF